MKYISKILIEVCVIAIATWVSLSFVVVAKDKEPHKPDSFQCPHCGTKLQWVDDELWRGYIECRSGWTAATPNPVTTNAGGWKVEVGSIDWELKHIYETNNPYCSGGDVVGRLDLEVKDLRLRVKRLEGKIETMTKPISLEEYITTNRVWITRDPIDNMPMYSVDNNGGLAL